MVRKLSNALQPNESPPHGASGDEVTQDDLNSVTVQANEFITVYSEQATMTKYLFWGEGNQNRQVGNIGDYFGDLQGTNDGGSTYEALSGFVRLEVYADERMEDLKAVSRKISLRELRNAEAESQLDRPLLDLQNPGASEDEHVAISVKVNQSFDGYTFAPSQGTFQMPQTEVNPRT